VSKLYEDPLRNVLVRGAVLSKPQSVSDFVHPKNNLEARDLRAFFVLTGRE
jgi:hypothetical protein